jgi:23S rRNA pseudouridine1911/1915/1917 synthase
MTGCETLEVHLPDPEPIDAVPQNIPLDIAYEDEDLLVINKPKGMVVHPAPGNPDGTVVNAVLYHCGESLSGIGGAFRPGIVHRIDKDTSGLLIIAKNDRAHLYLSEQLKDHTLARTYEAVVIGGLKEDKGTVNAPIGRSPKDRKKMTIVPDGRHAVTHYEVLARYPGYTHIRCKLETGRTHQIRVHMASLGHPIVGDEVYGPSKSKFDLQGQCLHARELTFLHPADGQPWLIKSDLPDYFTDLLHKLGRNV